MAKRIWKVTLFLPPPWIALIAIGAWFSYQSRVRWKAGAFAQHKIVVHQIWMDTYPVFLALDLMKSLDVYTCTPNGSSDENQTSSL